MSDARQGPALHAVMSSGTGKPEIEAKNLSLGYDQAIVVEDFDLTVEPGTITALVGPNGCGKSTILRALGRLLKPRDGAVYLDGKLIYRHPTREVARRLSILPQSPLAPEGLTVRDLVARGRFPHQSWREQWSEEDASKVDRAMRLVGMTDLADRAIDTLSGGQRQKAWIGVPLAQDTKVMLLDEPTTFLDVAHQIDILDLVRRLNRKSNTTVVMVLHDLNQASRYADRLVFIKEGKVHASGAPSSVMTAQLIREVFGVDCIVINDPMTGGPMFIPSWSKVVDSVDNEEGIGNLDRGPLP